MIGDSSVSWGGFTHSMATPPMANRTPEKMIALVPSPPSTFSKIQPNVTVWMRIGTAIIIFTMPMYTPRRSLSTMLATMKYGIPIMEAQAMPSRIMDKRATY
jgi:hypothetical protein